ncbi:MAG: hypothetical protein IT384_14525 [Deltaproteobacteria bacterium]|nr:hypothetical protein [Deltaproteobacteria bacterium]
MPARAWPRLVIALIILATALPNRSAFFALDEGIYYLDGARLLSGEVPYRDFFQFIPPGTMFFTRAFLGLFGDDALMATRFALLGIYVWSAWMLYGFAHRLTGRPVISLLAPLHLVVVSRNASWWVIGHHPLSNALLLLAVALLLRIVERPRRWDPFFLGLTLGAVIVVTQHVGALLTLAVLGLATWYLPEKSDRSRRTLLAAILQGASLPVGAVLLFLFANSALSDAFWCMVVYPATVYRPFHAEPYFAGGFELLSKDWSAGGLGAFDLVGHLLLVGLAPPIALSLGVVRQIATSVRVSPATVDPPLAAARLIIVTCAVVQFMTVASQPTHHAITQSSSLSFVILLDLVTPRGRFLLRRAGEELAALGPALRNALAALLLAWFAWDLSSALGRELRAMSVLREHAIVVPTRFGDLVHTDPKVGYELNLVLRKIREQTRPGEAILVFNWSAHLYLIADRPPATRFSGILPGHNSDAQFAQVIDAIRNRRPHLIVRDDIMDQLLALGDRRFSVDTGGAPYLGPLDLELSGGYRPVLLLSRFRVFAPIGEPRLR